MNFERSDLLINDAEQNSLTSALASVAQPDPIGPVILEKVDRVAAMTSACRVPAGWLKSLVRALVLYDLYSRLGPGRLPDNVREAYTEAQKDLTDLRDGRYRNLIIPGSDTPNTPNMPVTLERSREYTCDKQEGL
jgi:hypothetical protein